MSGQENNNDAAAASAGATCTETSLTEALKRLLTDESLSDVTLKGTDGVEVPVNKGLLAARSEVFRALLYGNFAEGGESIVSIGYPGPVLQAVVTYIYTDRLEPFPTSDDLPAIINKVKMYTSFVDAANYFHLPGLGEKAKGYADDEMKRDSALALLFLSSGVELNIPEIEQAALGFVRKKLGAITRESKANQFIKTMSPSLLQRLLQDEDIHADEKTLFLVLKTWAENGDDVEGRNRKEFASDMMQFIRLENIDPETLSNDIEPSGLVSDARLMEAYKSQALLLASDSDMNLFNKRRKLEKTHWKPRAGVDVDGSHLRVRDSTADWVTCSFDISAMATGCHKWRLKLVSLTGPYVGYFGVIPETAVEHLLHTSWYIESHNGITHYGKIHKRHHYHKGYGSPRFGEGSVLTFALSFQEDRGATLALSVDAGDEVVIFRNFAKGNALVPAVHLPAEAVVEILDMKRL